MRTRFFKKTSHILNKVYITWEDNSIKCFYYLIFIEYNLNFIEFEQKMVINVTFPLENIKEN